MGKGYKLTAATGSGPKTCAFYFSEKGCRNGTACKFSHEKSPAKVPSGSVSSSVPSSESDDSDGEIVESRAGAYASLARKDPESICPDASAGSSKAIVKEEPHQALSKQQQPSEKKKKKKRKKRDSGLASGENVFDLANAELAPASNKTSVTGAASPVAATASPNKKAKQVSTTATSPQNTNNLRKQHPDKTPRTDAPLSFRNLQLPVASFSLSVPATPPTSSAPSSPRPNERLDSQPDERPPPPPPPLPTATPAYSLWKDAVIATRGHGSYHRDFNFDRAQQSESSSGISDPKDWVVTSSRPYGPWCSSNPAAIAIDCETCETKCATTGTVNNKALCRLSVVNADNPDEVLLDTLVKPEWPVSNHRTRVNGITAANLENVFFTMEHAQMFMRALCSDQTVVVGHAVHNDLLALRIVHHCNVDTALLFAKARGTNASPSLKNLAHGLLRREMPDVHNSVNDARVALECALQFVNKNGKVDPVEKVSSKSRDGHVLSEGTGTASVLVHRLPPETTPAHITEMFLAYTCIKPKRVPDIIFAGSHGKCHVEFLTREHAELAYASLVGGESEDKGGKKQKRVGLKGGGYVWVRKLNKGK